MLNNDSITLQATRRRNRTVEADRGEISALPPLYFEMSFVELLFSRACGAGLEDQKHVTLQEFVKAERKTHFGVCRLLRLTLLQPGLI